MLRALASIGHVTAEGEGIQALLNELAEHAEVTVARVTTPKSGFFRRFRRPKH